MDLICKQFPGFGLGLIGSAHVMCDAEHTVEWDAYEVCLVFAMFTVTLRFPTSPHRDFEP